MTYRFKFGEKKEFVGPIELIINCMKKYDLYEGNFTYAVVFWSLPVALNN